MLIVIIYVKKRGRDMAKTISLSVGDSVLEKFDEFVEKIGGNRSTVINMLMVYCINTQKLPQITADAYTPSKDNSSL